MRECWLWNMSTTDGTAPGFLYDEGESCFGFGFPIPQYSALGRFLRMCFFFRGSFFSIRFGFSANRGRFTPAEPRNRMCASQYELTYSPKGTQCKNPLVHRRSSNYCRLAKIWFLKSEVAPNPKLGLFSNEGQLQIIFRRIMHRGQKLELRLWRSGFLSWVPLGETVDWFREMYGWFPQFMGQQRTWTQKRVKIERDDIWPHRIGNGLRAHFNEGKKWIQFNFLKWIEFVSDWSQNEQPRRYFHFGAKEIRFNPIDKEVLRHFFWIGLNWIWRIDPTWHGTFTLSILLLIRQRTRGNPSLVWTLSTMTTEAINRKPQRMATGAPATPTPTDHSTAPRAASKTIMVVASPSLQPARSPK